MRMKKLGRTGLELSVIGLGTWAIGGGDWAFSWGCQDDKESIATIRNALDLGINWIDTAPVYGLGHSEEIVGKALQEVQNKPLIATKCGLVWNEKRKISPQLIKESIRLEVDASLKRLQLDVIDLYQIHWPRPDNSIEEAWETIAALIEEGKIRFAAVCNFNVEQLRRIESIHPVASLQTPYSMLERGIEDGILEYCASSGCGVIVYSPLQKGILTGKFTLENIKNFASDDHRKYDNHFKEPVLSANFKFIEGLRPIAEKNGITLAQLAIAWVLYHNEVTVAIVGARHAYQIEETVIAGDCILSEHDITEIEILLQDRLKELLK